MPGDAGWKHNNMDSKEIFDCLMCGDCCEGFGGNLVTPENIEAIAAFLGMDAESFKNKYCVKSGLGVVLAQGENGKCVFWDRLCTIHPVKPRMCRRWPFIPAVLKEPSNWALMADACPGIKADADTGLVVEIVARELAREKP